MSQEKLSTTLAIATATRNFRASAAVRPGNKIAKDEPKTSTAVGTGLINTGVPKVARTM